MIALKKSDKKLQLLMPTNWPVTRILACTMSSIMAMNGPCYRFEKQTIREKKIV
jgi:hypothetical protein